MVTVFDDSLFSDSLDVANQLRNANIPTILFTDKQKIQKQFKFADRIGIPIVLVLGPEEKINNQITVKNLKTRNQENVAIDNLVIFIKEQLA